jgi:hypothetical protein
MVAPRRSATARQRPRRHQRRWRQRSRQRFITSCESPVSRQARRNDHRSGARGSTCANSSWAGSRCGSWLFVHPQRPTRAPPADACHPGRWQGRGRRGVSGHRDVLPPRKVRTRAPRIDARGGAEVFAEIEQHINHARPHLPRRRQRSRVIPSADDFPSAAEGAVDSERQPNGEPVHTAAGAARLIPLDDEVAVVLLDRKMDHAKAIDRRARDGAPERAEHPR